MSENTHRGSADWDPQRYDAFADQRRRPARDLLAAVTLGDADRITDLGCGTGLSTELLAERWPGARLTALDRSGAMLERAQQRVPTARFVRSDIALFESGADQDLLFANASLHWLTGHESLLRRLLDALRPGGVLAVQMPVNLDEPSHRLMRATAASQAFRQALDEVSGVRPAMLGPGAYYDCLAPRCRQVDVWETRYLHALPDVASIADWFASTGLKPWLDALHPGEHDAFRSAYIERLEEAYPRQVDGRVLLAVPRLFIIAVRS